MQETRVQSLGWEDRLEKRMANHSGILAWEISWREGPSRLQFMGLERVIHDLATKQQTMNQKQRMPQEYTTGKFPKTSKGSNMND